MRRKGNTMSRAKLRAFFALASTLLFLGCSSGNDAAPKLNAGGLHPVNWLQVHYIDFVNNPDQCRTCHGSTTDPAQAGGIAKVSCFSCHPKGPSHQTGWALPSQHGRMGAQKVATATSGFAYCAKCHGSNYDNPIGTAPSCKSCHTKAPHPDKPWVGSSEALPNHVFADVTNATECIKCHLAGANSTMKPSAPPAAGAAPGCFNNTMCHSRNI